MINTKNNSRRKFIGTMAAGATAGLSFLSNPVKALNSEVLQSIESPASNKADEMIKEVGKMQHPVAFDGSQAVHWGLIWSNVYYMTNEGTGTAPKDLGVLNVLRHHGIIFSLNDEVIKKYNLGEVFGYNDPVSSKPALRNPMYIPGEGDMPMPVLTGIKGLQEKGAKFCTCDMAYRVYSGIVANNMGLNAEDVYNDWVANKIEGVELAPSGVWALGRLAENKIAYIDACLG
ncbi:Tat (twin-arginine translocation) pathway signal sequence containing protein [Marivirga sp.]|uniref:Tat (twin-arginine translocation) pathway signal sequence containing protein n=1 Tax=Marivirga sp. TaxID=2018662 RepID=UPI0025DAB934|nr:Tat (twin-arginine translocation) pathway signal sequence containing protein [Marivirga sp.]